MRSATLTLRKPEPTGVVMGPLSPTPLARIDSMTRSGSGVPSDAIVVSPASWTSQSKPMPVAWRTALGGFGKLGADPVAGNERDGVAQRMLLVRPVKAPACVLEV